MTSTDYVRDLARVLGLESSPGSVSTDIDPRDLMFTAHPDLDAYMEVGRLAVIVVLESMLAVGALRARSPPKKVLDLGCGYGRVFRHLANVFGGSELHCMDVGPLMPEYCSLQFGGIPTALSADFVPPREAGGFDIIWCGSVLAHLSLSKAQRMVAGVCESLRPGGLAVLTLHGRRAIEMHESGTVRYCDDEKWKKIVHDCRTSGWGFRSYDLPEYGDLGVSLADLRGIRTLLGDRPQLRLAHYGEAGWADHQDVMTLLKLGAR